MFKYRKVISASLVVGFAAVMIVLTACTLDAAALCPATGGADTAEGPAVGADDDCCLTCAAKATVVDSPGFSVPAVSLLPLATTGYLPAVAPLSLTDLAAAAVRDVATPPVFLLNAAFLI